MGFELLRPYQIEDANFLAQLDACACFNEQRTGKTPTALYICELKQIKKLLVVCPATAIYPWVDAIQEWTGKPALAYTGTRQQRAKLLTQWQFALVASYDTLKQLDAGSKKEIHQLLALKPDGIIADEAHRIGHPSTARSKAMFAVRNHIPFRIALTGSPAIGLSKDVWGILHFLYPKTFSSYWNFINEFYKTWKAYGTGGREFKEIGDMLPHMVPTMQSILRRISTQRKRKEVMQWLPPKDHQVVRLPMTKQQIRYIQELDTVWETEHIITMGTLDRIMRKRQICLDPGILQLEGGSPKTDWILQYLVDYPERPTLIFSKFTAYLERLQKVTHAALICGSTPLKERNAICSAFQNGAIDVVLLNIDACKEAITLDRAEAAIFTDKYPPIGDIEQAEDRFVATTEGRAAKPHIIYELVMKDSYDEDILLMLAQRKSETDIINDYKTKYERTRTST